MKNIRFKFIGMLILVLLILGSCKKWIDTGINVNPDAPNDAPMKSILPSIEANMGYNTVGGNDYARVQSIWMQYFQGVDRQAQGEASYIWNDGDVDNLWNTNYANTMMDLVQLRTKASGSPTYLGIADVLMAESLGMTTDVWGDIPYHDAFKGVNSLNPAFDRQDTVYNNIYALLDEAIAKLSSSKALAEGDLIYSGDPAMWLKAAHGLKARYLLHLSKQKGTAFADALAALEGSLASNDDDMQFVFNDVSGYENPLYQFLQQRSGYITMHKTFMDMLTLRQDPRKTVYAAKGPSVLDPYQGADWVSSGDSASTPGDAVGAANAPVLFLSYAECLFIKAECELKTEASDDLVKADILEGLTASLKKWGVFSNAYVSGYDSLYLKGLPHDALYAEIMAQKYLALYNQAESFVDWRRTNNMIGLQPNPAEASKGIPRRYPYSLGEKSFNPNTPKGVTLWNRVWWDAGGKK
jgi:hypothetical protein